jgi:hypothetical protein
MFGVSALGQPFVRKSISDQVIVTGDVQIMMEAKYRVRIEHN